MRKQLAIALIGVANWIWPKEKSARIVCQHCGLRKEVHVSPKHIFTPSIQYACECHSGPIRDWLPSVIKVERTFQGGGYAPPTTIIYDETLEKVN